MANTEKKMTNKTALEMAIACVSTYGDPTDPNTVEAVGKLQKMLESLEKKKSSPSKAQTAKATANAGLGEIVLGFLRDDPHRMVTVSEMLKEIPGLPAEITNQKLTYILRMDAVKPFVKKEMVKGKALYSYNSTADAVEDED